MISAVVAGPTQCPDPTSKNCGVPQWPNYWSMRPSLYTYCFENCPLEYFANNTHLGVFGGVVGVDHYWTGQGMPCVGGRPQEFEHQDAFADATKAQFPGTRVLLYRITDAVPYAGIVHDLMVAHPEYFIRWTHAPNNNGSICQMPYAEHGTGRPGDNCDWPIIASAYDFSQEVVQTWFLENVIKPVMVHGDGVWLDGDGPDNGAWMCSGSYDYPNLPAPYPPLNETEIDAFCVGENAVQAAAHEWLFANGGMDGQACWTYVTDFPVPSDGPVACASKLLAIGAFTAGTAVGFAMDRTGGRGYSDATAAQTVAAFLLTRKEQWFFGVTQSASTINATTAALLLSDYGAPAGPMTNSSAFLFQRAYARATVALDCSTFTATFTPTA